MSADFGTPISPVSEPKKSKTTLIIVIVVVVILLCCCCAAAVGLWQYGDQIMNYFGY
jgi:flagellar basal body-associated protein FliL